MPVQPPVNPAVAELLKNKRLTIKDVPDEVLVHMLLWEAQYGSRPTTRTSALRTLAMMKALDAQGAESSSEGATAPSVNDALKAVREARAGGPTP